MATKACPISTYIKEASVVPATSNILSYFS